LKKSSSFYLTLEAFTYKPKRRVLMQI